MKLEQKMVSLEIAKKLHTLGLKQESLWYYQCPKWDREQEAYAIVSNDYCTRQESDIGPNYYSAYTFTELYEVWYKMHSGAYELKLDVEPEELANYLAKVIIHNIENDIGKIKE